MTAQSDEPVAGGPPHEVGDGHELLAWLRRRREHTPVWADEETGSFHVFRHADAVRVLSEPDLFSSDFSALAPPPDPGSPDFSSGALSVTDPPFHGRLRGLISQAFTPRTVAGLEGRIGEVTDQLLDSLDGRTEIDLVSDIAYPLPVTVIAELLGIPSQDQDLFRSWAELLLPDVQEVRVGRLGDGPQPAERARRLNMMRDYLLSHVRDRRGKDRGDLISRLVAAEQDGERLTDDQAVNFSAFLLLAGHLTTTLLLGNALLCLQEEPGAMARLREDRSLVPAAVEETLRHRPPVVFQYRLAKRDTEIGGVPVPAGRIVVSWVLSANRDAERFPDPDRFLLDRGSVPHLTFSHGIHYCLGAPLARMEAVTLFNRLLDRYGTIECGEPVFQRRPDVFGVRSLPLHVKE
ncbi:cytochrome P450 [Nocardiopsis sp. CA-288880]|uniref:cytochrome P450 n=1 Tax=Nocardiopsis sp. CA-288880 TaxID=3239995 RepID=UPI003D962E06